MRRPAAPDVSGRCGVVGFQHILTDGQGECHRLIACRAYAKNTDKLCARMAAWGPDRVLLFRIGVAGLATHLLYKRGLKGNGSWTAAGQRASRNSLASTPAAGSSSLKPFPRRTREAGTLMIFSTIWSVCAVTSLVPAKSAA